MENSNSSNEIFILLALRNHFSGHRISNDRLLEFVKEHRPSVDNKLWLITKNLHDRYLIVTNPLNEHEITEAGEKYIKEEQQNILSAEMLQKTFKLTRRNTNWVIVGSIAAILGLVAAICFNCHHPSQ